MHHTSRQHNARTVLHTVIRHGEPISSCLHSFISLTAASVLSRINPRSNSHISSPLQHVARYQWADHHLATISRGPSRKPSAPSVRLKHKILPSSCFQLTTSHESRLAPFCSCFFHRAALPSPPRHAVLRVLFLAPSHRDSYPVSRRFARLLRNRAHATNKWRDCCLLLFPLLQQSKKV
jgi:hypothetical protein